MKDSPAEKWETVPLGELCEFRRGLTYKKGDEVETGGTPVLRANNVDLAKGELDLDEIRYIDPAIEVPKAKKVVAGSLLICTASGSKKHLGKTALIEDEMDFAFGGFMGLLVPRPTILPKYLQWLLRSDAYWSFIDGLSDGANINNLKFKQLAEFPVPLPPLEEQQRIVAVLDEAFEGLARARTHAEANLQNARELVATSTDALCSEVNNDWKIGKMGDFCAFEGGFAFKSGDAVKQSQVQLIRIGNLYQNILDLERKPVFYPDNFAESYSKFRLKAGDIILSLTGTVGKQDYGFAVAVPKTDRALLLNQRVARIMPKSAEILSPNFLLRFLRSASFLATLYNISRGTRQANLSTRDMADLPMAVPPMSKQFEIAESLDSIDAGSAQLIAAYEKSIVDLDELRQSLLQKAFAGELT